MVKLLVVVLTAFAVIGAGSLVIGEDNEQDKVIAYYFHGNTRCYSCNILEQYSRQAIEDNFQDELASNRLIFKTVNVQEKANDHFRKDYGLYSQSLVLSLIENGREKKFENLTMIWQYVRDRQRFINYVKDEISAYLKELS
jgi:hypothetical protein